MLTLFLMTAAVHSLGVAQHEHKPSRFRFIEPVPMRVEWSLPPKTARAQSIVEPFDDAGTSRRPRPMRLHTIAAYTVTDEVEMDIFTVRNGGGGSEAAIGFSIHEPFNP